MPTLRSGDIVVLDNLSAHKSTVAQRAIGARGAPLVFLPAYSPDFNPIELAFAKLKQRLRMVAARTFDAIMTATQEQYSQITANDARGFFRHAGYNL